MGLDVSSMRSICTHHSSANFYIGLLQRSIELHSIHQFQRIPGCGDRQVLDISLSDEMYISFMMEFCSIFETSIRYVGGLLSAYELSGKQHQILVDKAKEVADKMAYAWQTLPVRKLTALITRCAIS